MCKKENKHKKILTEAEAAIENETSITPSIKIIFKLLISLNLELISTIKELKNTIKELTKKLNLNSKNSSKPPSSDQSPRGNRNDKDTGKKPGGQSGRKGTTLKKVSNPDNIQNHKLQGKCSCGQSLSKLNSYGYATRQVWDLLINTIITEHRAHRAICTCGKKHKANFPKNVTNNTQYGDKIKAIASYFSQYQLIPFERTKEMFKDIFNLDLSAGTVCNANTTLATNLDIFDKKLKEALASSEVNHSDETGINIAGKNNYLHVLSNKAFTLLYPHKNRGHVAIDEMAILPDYKGVLVHDFYRAYYKYNCRHAYCGSHLIRELIFSEEQEEQNWAKKLRILLQIANNLKRKNRLSESIIDRIESYYSKILLAALIECPLPIKRKIELKNKKIKFKSAKKTKSRCLLERFRDYRSDILRFLYDPLVPFTNNLAERDLRMAKVHQKISGCFRTINGARTYARIRSYISTIKKQNLNVIDGIIDTLSSSDNTLNQLFG